MRKIDFNIRIGNIETRSCDKHLLTTYNEHETAEIVKWEGKSCYTLAFWEKGSSGFNLKFVDRRPFDCGHMAFFLEVAETGQNFLDSYFRSEEDDL